MAKRPRVVAGVDTHTDTHADTHHVAVIDDRGRHLTDRGFPTTATGYRQILAFLKNHGQVMAVGVEATGSYGAELTRRLSRAGIRVVEVARPDRATRHRRGKSDPVDAYAAARAVLAATATSVPKSRDGLVESMRMLQIARASAIKARTVAINQIKAILVAAGDTLRARYRDLNTDQLLRALADTRPAGQVHTVTTATVTTATVATLRILAIRCQTLTSEIAGLDAQLDELTDLAAPGLKARHGIGTQTTVQLLVTAGDNPDRFDTDAQFAALTGVAPLPASSGKTNRHRPSHGGDRAANAAIHRIVLIRMGTDQRTRDYVTRRRTEGLSTKAYPPRKSCDASNATSPVRSTTSSPTPHQHPDMTIYAPPDSPPAKPSPPPPPTSTSGPPNSPASNEDSPTTQTSNTATANG